MKWLARLRFFATWCIVTELSGYVANKHFESDILRIIITFLSTSWVFGGSPIHHQRKPRQSPKATKYTIKMTRFGPTIFFFVKEENCPFKTTKFSVSLIHYTLSPSLSGKLPICHPRGLSESPKSTKTTTKITRINSAFFSLKQPS